MDQGQSKANVVKVFQVEGVELRLTDKGAISIYALTGQGNYQWKQSLTPAMVKMHAESFGCPVFQSIVESPEFKQVIENKAKAKAQAYIDKQAAHKLDKVAKTLQSVKDQLSALGVDPNTALASLLKPSA